MEIALSVVIVCLKFVLASSFNLLSMLCGVDCAAVKTGGKIQ